MKKKVLITMFFIVLTMCLFAVSISAETAYVNSKGEQVEADSADIAYEIYVTDPYQSGGNCRIVAIYLHDATVTKIVFPEIKFTNSNGNVYDLSTYSYCRLATGYNVTLPVYLLADKEAEEPTSIHTQIKEIEFHIPVLGDGAGSVGNLAGYSALEKLSFYKRAYEPQSKGGFLSGCENLKEIHFYGENNKISGNFFCSSITKVVFHRGSTSSLSSCAMQSINGKECTVYLNSDITPWSTEDPRFTWNKSGDSLKFVILVDDTTGYTDEEIASYQTDWQAGNNKSESNYKYTATIQTYCDFYAEHLSYSEINACVGYCEVCKFYNALENPVHAVAEAYEYANGYALVGNKREYCSNEGCQHTVDTEIPALFTPKGYSKDTTSNAIVLEIIVNNGAIDKYEAYLKSVNEEATLAYGIVVAIADNDEDTSNDVLFDENGEVKAGTIAMKAEKNNFSNIKTKITGIGEGNYDTALHCSGYINVNGVVTYVNGAGTAEYAEKVTYNSIPNKE